MSFSAAMAGYGGTGLRTSAQGSGNPYDSTVKHDNLHQPAPIQESCPSTCPRGCLAKSTGLILGFPKGPHQRAGRFLDDEMRQNILTSIATGPAGPPSWPSLSPMEGYPEECTSEP